MPLESYEKQKAMSNYDRAGCDPIRLCSLLVEHILHQLSMQYL